MKIQVEVWGGGGGASGNHTAAGETGGTGGGGGYSLGTFNVTPGSTYAITVGIGGAAASFGAVGGNGGQSSFGNLISATGGGGGTAGGGAGGQGSGGQLNMGGGYGFDIGSISVVSRTTSDDYFGARGGDSPRGGSGGGMYSGWTNAFDGSTPNLGLNGVQPGGGGAGNYLGSGSGAPGAVLIHY